MIYGGPSQINATSIAEAYDASISSTTEINLNAAARTIQASAFTNSVFLKWGTSDASSSDFDVVIPANQSYFLQIPYQSDGRTLYTAINVIEAAASAAFALSQY